MENKEEQFQKQKELIENEFKKSTEKFGYTKMWINFSEYSDYTYLVLKLSEDEFLFCKNPLYIVDNSNKEKYIEKLNSYLLYASKRQLAGQLIEESYHEKIGSFNDLFHFFRTDIEKIVSPKESTLNFFKDWNWNLLNGQLVKDKYTGHYTSLSVDLVPLNKNLFKTETASVKFDRDVTFYLDALKVKLPLCKTDFEVLDCILDSNILMFYESYEHEIMLDDILPKKPQYPSRNLFRDDYDYHEALKRFKIELHEYYEKEKEAELEIDSRWEKSESTQKWRNLYSSYVNYLLSKNLNIRNTIENCYCVRFSDNLFSFFYFSVKNSEILRLIILSDLLKVLKIAESQTNENVVRTIAECKILHGINFSYEHFFLNKRDLL